MLEPKQAVNTPPVAHDISGRTIGRFVLRKLLGAGGMGQVYLAEDTVLKRVVAIKRMAPRLRVEDTERRRFIKEAQRASALNHPNIAGIYDVIDDKQEVLIVMEHVEGTTLRGRIRAPIPLTMDEFLSIGIQCAEGLGAAHHTGIVHGDIKPENLMLTPANRVKVLDFGVARRPTQASASTPTQSIETIATTLSGTPAYMAPEVLTEEPYDGRADIFSLGLVFYEMLGGAQPFLTDSFIATVGRVLHKEPPSVRGVNPKVPDTIEAIVQRMLAKNPADRYATCEDVAADLRAVQRGERPKAMLGRKSGKRLLSTRKWAAVAAIAFAVMVAMAAISPLRHRVAGWARVPASGHNPTAASDQSQTATQTKTLVVLPIEAPSTDPKLAAFEDGLINTLTAKLTRLSEDHPLQVVSASELKTKNVRSLEEARKEFGANLGLRISLQRSADLVRLTYTLLDAKTGRPLRGNTIDTPLNDPFALEDQVANGAAAALGIELRPEEQRELVSHGTTVPEAYTYYVQGRGYIENLSRPENIDSAIVFFERALQLDPNYGMAQAELGAAYWLKYDANKDKKLIAKARQACSKAIALGNSGASGHVCLGTLDNGTGEYELAADEFRKAVQLDPSNDLANVGLASAYEHLGKLDDAENTYQQIIKLRPQYWRGYNLLATFYLRQAQYGKSAAMMQRVINLTPDSFRGYANLGAIYLADAKYSDAINPLDKALQIHATSATYTNLGTAYFHLRRYSDAVPTYEQAVKLDPSDYTNWGNLGEAYYRVGDKAKAEQAFRKAVALAEEGLKVNPRDPDVLKSLADYHVMLGERAPALKYLDAALRYGKFDKEILFSAALIYNHLGETGPALEWLQKALQAGYSLDTVRESPDLDNLHGNSQYQTLVQERQDFGPGAKK